MARKSSRFHSKTRNDCCLKCNTPFKKHFTEIIWKDVVECKWCGNIWVLLSLEEYKRWT